MKRKQVFKLGAICMACVFCTSFLSSCSWEKGVFFSEEKLSANHVENLPVPEYKNGYCNDRTFCATVESEEYFQEYVQSVYDYLWEQGLYTGVRGKAINGMAWFTHFAFNVESEPRTLGDKTYYEFLYTSNEILEFPAKEEEDSAGELPPQSEDGSSEQKYYYGNRGRVQGVICLKVSYSADMRKMDDENPGGQFEYNFKMEFPIDLGSDFYADADQWVSIKNSK